MAKVGVAICEARTGQSEAGGVEDVDEDNAEPMIVEDAAATQSVKPAAFKTLVGKGHPEFSSARQQASRPTATSLQLPQQLWYPQRRLSNLGWGCPVAIRPMACSRPWLCGGSGML